MTFLANLYAFGVIWSFALKGIAVLVLRYTHPQDREFRVPLNFHIGGVEIPVGLGLITLVLLSIAVVNLFTKPAATVSGVIFSVGLFVIFELSEKRIQKQRGVTHVELDQFNLDAGRRSDGRKRRRAAGQHSRAGEHVLCALSSGSALCGVRKRGDAEIVVLHVRMLRRAASGEYDLAPDQLFSTIEQLLFTKVLSLAEKEGKPVRLAVAAANDLWEGILRTAVNLQSSTIVAGSSAKVPVTDQAREIGLAWERMPDPRPRVTLEIFTPSGQEADFLSRPARSAAHAKRNRSAAQAVA